MRSQEVTRLAPSPTGALHLGNARTFLVNWALARQLGWRIVLRVEDLDGPRVKPGAIGACLEDLAWLGIDWDEGPVVQTDEIGPHEEAMRVLAAAGLVYRCELTRAEIESAASAPHEREPGAESVFPAHLRPAAVGPTAFVDTGSNWRFVVGEGEVAFLDSFAGAQRSRPAQSVGDFVVWTKRGHPSYQLAVVVDDHRQGVTQVVRADDLLGSAGRQLLLYRALGMGPEPVYTHLPLVVGTDGRRLAKRHGDTRIASYREIGVHPHRLIGLLAFWCGMRAGPGPMSASEFCSELVLASIPREQVVFSQEDDRWLRE